MSGQMWNHLFKTERQDSESALNKPIDLLFISNIIALYDEPQLSHGSPWIWSPYLISYGSLSPSTYGQMDNILQALGTYTYRTIKKKVEFCLVLKNYGKNSRLRIFYNNDEHTEDCISGLRPWSMIKTYKSSGTWQLPQNDFRHRFHQLS